MMTLKELKTEISNSRTKEQFDEFEVEFKLPHENLEESFVGLLKIYEYFQRQYEGWNVYEEEIIPDYLLNSKEHYKAITAHIENIVAQNNDFSINNNLQELRKLINLKAKGSRYNPRYLFTPESLETNFLIELNRNYPDAIENAIKFLVNQKLQFPQEITAEGFTGYLKAYEFRVLNEKREEDRASGRHDFSRIRSEYDNYVSTVKIDHINEFDMDQSSRDKEFKDWFTQSKKSSLEFNTNSIQKVKELEELYNTKLGLQAPADYWEKRAMELDNDGKKWRSWLLGSIVTSVILLVTIIFLISYPKFEDLFSSTGNAIRFSILFIALMSIIAFAIKVFSKLMMSSYHLKRDALERKQLAYFYLALIASGGIEKEERHLIIQSLFSRSDSGLLKDDAGPSMPSGGSVIEKIIGGK